MADHKYFDATHPLTPTANALIELAAEDTVFLALGAQSATLLGIKGAGKNQVLIHSAGVVHTQLNALEILGDENRIHNEGFVTSIAGTGVLLSGGGTNRLTNLGTITGVKGVEVANSTLVGDKLDLLNAGSISAIGVAVKGTFGGDRVVNKGTLQTKEVDALLVDLAEGNDYYDGTLGVVNGRIALGLGNDTAIGGAGSETFSGDGGDDSIDGGAGVDTVDYSAATVACRVDLSNTSWQFTGQGMDLLLNFENVIGTALNDTLLGNAGDNKLVGNAGDDTLEGGLGTDILDGGGAAAGDTARYAGSAAAFINLAVTGTQNTLGYGYDTLIGIENLEGGSGADNFTGNDGANLLIGNGGNDTFRGGNGNDTIEGGTGQDTAEYSGPRANYTVTTNTDGSVQVVGPEGDDLLKDIRFVKFANNETVALTNANPTAIRLSATSIAENAAPNTTVGTLSGTDPDGDSLTFSLESNAGGLFTLTNGNSVVLSRALDFETAGQHIISVRARDAYGGEFVQTLTITVRNVVETTPFTIYGTAGNDDRSGEAGNDQLFGFEGNDQLAGGAGNDILRGGLGNDVLIGGAGADFFVLDSKPNVRTNVDVLYDFNAAEDTIQLVKGAFAKVASKKGVLPKAAFWVGDRVHDSSDRIFYNKKTGGLFYDADGTGRATGLQIAVMQKNLALTYKDFDII